MRIKFRVEYRDLDSRACPPHQEETTFQKVKVEQPKVRKSPTGEPMFLSLPRSVTSLLPPGVVERRDPDELEYHLSWYLLQEKMVGPKVKLRDYPWWGVERPMAVLNLDRLLHRWWSLRYGREPIPPWWEPWTLEEYQLDPLQLAKLGAPQEVDWTQWSLLPIPWGLHLYWIAVSKRRPPSTACGCGRPLRLYNVEPGGKCPACLLRARWEVEMAEEFPPTSERAELTQEEKTAWVRRLLGNERIREERFLRDWRAARRQEWAGLEGPEKDWWTSHPEYGLWEEHQESRVILQG